jgi:ATP-binding cassette, subfamily B, bacterial PglK
LFKFIKNTKKILDLIDKSNQLKLALINVFFIINAIFQLLFVLSFYLLIQSFSNPEKFLSNKLVINFSQFMNLESDLSLLNNYFIIIFFTVVVLSNISLILSNSFKFHFSYNLLTKLRSKLYNYFLSQNFSKFIKKNSAEYINVILSDCERFAMQIVSNLMNIFLTIVSLIFVLIPIIILNFKVTIISSFLIFILFFVVSKFLKPVLFKFGYQIKNYSKNRYEILNDSFRNFNEIKLENLTKLFNDRYLDRESSINKIGNKLSIINHASKPIIEIILISIFFILYLLVFDVDMKIVQYTDIIGITLVTLYKLLPLANSAYQSINELNYHKIVINSLIQNLLNNEISKKYTYKDSIPKKINNIIFKDITFEYDKKNSFKLNKLNFKLSANSIIGIEGISGSGKTTILNILTGLLKPKLGYVLINNKKINIINNNNWFKKISYVSQSVNIFNETIYKNISYNLNDKESVDTIRKIKNILVSLNLNEFLKKNKTLDEFGKTVSGGQLQRIAIARAFFKNSEIIIFDEPTRNLDKKNEKALLHIIKKLKKNKIIIYISHNKESLKICDKIIKI